jgi:transposase InsO family protein
MMRLALFRTRPTPEQVIDVVRRAIRRAGVRPKHLLTDKGEQFRDGEYKAWCRRTGIDRRHGSLGQFGSIPFIERVIETIKAECTRRIGIPYAGGAAREELRLYRSWYNSYRPHERLRGATPDEVYAGLGAQWKRPRFEPRPGWNRSSGRGDAFTLHVRFLAGRRYLPIVSLRRVA